MPDNDPHVTESEPVVVLAIVDAVLVGLFFLFRVLPWARPGPWRLIWLIASLTSVMFIASELVALVTGGTALSLEHQIPLFGAILAVSTGFILTYLSGSRDKEQASALAGTDPLTQLGNARAFDSRLKDLAATRRPFALLYMDLDGLKQVNDQAGHAAGDALLQRFAAVMKGHVRKRDLAARLGGDEFALVLPEADEASARRIGERILAGLAGATANGERPLTVSIGMLANAHRLPPAEAVRIADAAMYDAKAAGGGRIMIAST